jgi:hypothetical protein
MAQPGNNYPPRKDVLDKQKQLSERQRKEEIADLPAAATGGGGTEVWTARTNSVGWQGTGVSGEFVLPLDSVLNENGVWTLEDHYTTGHNTLLVPPEEGAYALTATFAFRVQTAGPFDMEVSVGLAIVDNPASSYGIQHVAEQTIYWPDIPEGSLLKP